MNNIRINKAFTLIELLAVIAILAIILMIAVPNVISIIEKTKKAAFEKGAYFLVDAAEKNHAKAIVNNEEGEYEYYFKDGIQYAADGNEIEFEGKVPENGIIQISEEGKVTMAIHDGTYCACKDSNMDIVEVEEKILDECTADRVVLEDGTWDEIADKYNIPKEVLLEYNDVDESVDPSTIDIKIPINVTGTTTLQELATYKTYYSIGYVLSNDTFPKTFSYTIELDNLPVEIEDITQIEVEEEKIITQIEDFRSYIVKRNMGDVVYGEGDNLYYDLETADIFKEHSVTSDNMTINNISVTCTTRCEATISVTVNNINDVVPIEMNGSNIIYTPVMFTVEFNGDLLVGDAKIYGVTFDPPTVVTGTRTDNAEGLTTTVTETTITSDFDNAEIYNEIEEVTDIYGNQFIKIPKFWIKKIKAGNIWTYQISKEQQDENYYLPYCFNQNGQILDYVLVGKYAASLNVDKLESKTGTTPLVSKTITQFRNYARANGTGYGIIDIHIIDVIQTLFYIEFATLDSQSIMKGRVYGSSIFDNGTADSIITTGSPESNTDGYHVMKYRGIENVWGNMSQFVDGINVQSYRAYVSNNMSNYQSNVYTGDYQALTYINTNTTGYITEMGYDESKPFAQFPISVASSGTGFYKDNLEIGSSSRPAVFGGTKSSGTGAGISYWNFNYGFTNTYTSVGSRLIKIE